MEYIKSIALFLIFVSFIGNVFDFGHMKKYIKLFCGIVLIFILLQPVKEILGGDCDIGRILEMNELELKMAELKEGIDSRDTALGVIEENVKEIVWEEGYELTYILVTPDEKNSGVIGCISISIKEKNNDIKIEAISFEPKEEKNKTTVESVRISEKIAEAYDIEQNDVIVNIE